MRKTGVYWCSRKREQPVFVAWSYSRNPLKTEMCYSMVFGFNPLTMQSNNKVW